MGKNEIIIYDLKQQVKNGAASFYWVAILSWINIFTQIARAKYHFITGLGITQLFTEFSPEIAALVNLFVILFFLLFAYFGQQGNKKAFALGITLYAIDGLLFLLVGDFMSLSFHIIILFTLIKGYRALNKLKIEYKVTDSHFFHKTPSILKNESKKKWVYVFLFQLFFLVLVGISVLTFKRLGQADNIAENDWYVMINIMSFLIVPFVLLISLFFSLFLGTHFSKRG